ncbi:MAG: MerR family transcriptional regulator [Acidimicrobiales bacterium]
MSERTLRYYEEVGLLLPAAHSPGGMRLYAEPALARVRRIRELQSLMGFNLEEIHAVMSAEDHLDELRGEFQGSDAERKRELLLDASATVEELRAKVRSKVGHLQAFLAELDARAARQQDKLKQFGPRQPEPSQPAPPAQGLATPSQP